MSDKTAVRRGGEDSLCGGRDNVSQITHASRPLLKFSPTSVTMRREGPSSQVSALESVRIRNVATFVYVELEDS